MIDPARLEAQIDRLDDAATDAATVECEAVAVRLREILSELRALAAEREKEFATILQIARNADACARRIEIGNLPHQRGQVLGHTTSLIYYLERRMSVPPPPKPEAGRAEE